jgi:hypothetical protein
MSIDAVDAYRERAKTVTLDEQIACVARELRLRESTYAKWVHTGRMKQIDADTELARMVAVLNTLKRIADLEFNDRHARSNMQAVWDYLKRVSPWAESNDMDWADEIICGISLLQERAEYRHELEAFVQRIAQWGEESGELTELTEIPNPQFWRNQAREVLKHAK